jgi:hypothetical protein
MAYLRYLRVLYITLSDKYAKPGSLTASNPKSWARWSVGGEVTIHILILFFIAVRLFGPPPELSKNTVRVVALVFSLVVESCIWRFVIRESSIAKLREELTSQTRVDSASRRFGIGVSRLATTLLFFALLFTL